MIAEGVEEEQADFLAEHGCHWIQVFYYSQPILAGTFENLYLKTLSQRS